MAKRKRESVLDSVKAMVGADVQLRAIIDEELLNAEIASLICRARTAAGLTQAQLARLVSTTQSTIARLEDANYNGHSLSMLRRIASALRQRLEIRFTPAKQRPRAA